MRRKANDRERMWPDFPNSPCPGDDYYWDGDHQKWVHIEDDDDMSWMEDALMGRDANPDKKVSSMNDENSGKKWKETMRMKISGGMWDEIKKNLVDGRTRE